MLSTVSESRTIHTYAGASLELIHAPAQEALIEQSVRGLHLVTVRQGRRHQDKANWFGPWIRSDMCKSEGANELNASTSFCDWESQVASPAQCMSRLTWSFVETERALAPFKLLNCPWDPL